ncbi:MAG: TylF/MycF/NovP-related O-methyltransferase [Candidatus Hodarchaeota archaeon]
MLKYAIRKILNNFGYEIRRKDIVETFFQIDPLFNSLYKEAQTKTQMESSDNILRRQRHYVLNYLLRNADLRSGHVCEVGCWRGLSAYQMGTYLRSQNIDVILHIFDSFEGLSRIESMDRYEHDKRGLEIVRKRFACSLEEVQDNLKEFNFIKYYKGWIPERFPEVKDEKFSFVHIDVDLYQPTYDCFQFFYPRLIKDGLMVFDDYGCIYFPGAKKAIDQCVAMLDHPFFIPLPSGQAFLIKG